MVEFSHSFGIENQECFHDWQCLLFKKQLRSAKMASQEALDDKTNAPLEAQEEATRSIPSQEFIVRSST